MDKILGMLGMAKRAGKVTSGSFLCEKAIRQKDAQLIVIARDAADNAKQDMIHLCKRFGVSYIEYAEKTALGNSIGAGERAVVAINDQNFAQALLAKYSKN